VSGVYLHDYGCTLKAYRREVITGFRLYGEMHRFIPIYAHTVGAKIIEVKVHHHARKFGKAKYGMERTLKVVLADPVKFPALMPKQTQYTVRRPGFIDRHGAALFLFLFIGGQNFFAFSSHHVPLLTRQPPCWLYGIKLFIILMESTNCWFAL
jgi:hypothetical protein